MEKLKNNRPLKRVLFASLTIIFLAVIVIFTISKLSRFVDKAVSKTAKIGEYNLLAQNLLGLNGKKNILILFMNNAEQRYGGGFIGSVGYVSVDGGKIKPDPVKSVYYYDRYSKTGMPPIDLSDPELGLEAETLRNSGQNINWIKNGERAREIFNFRTGKNPDIIIAITPEVLKYLLEVTGPVYLDEYNKEINSKNIIDSLQTEVEYGKDKTEGRDPKSIMTSLANNLITRISQKNFSELSNIFKGLEDEAKKNQIILYSSNYDFMKIINKLGYDGAPKRNFIDYISVYEQNQSIDKSNAYIDRELSRKVSIAENGEVLIHAEIKRTQNREKSIPYVDPRENSFTYLIKENISSLRIVLPKNSKMIADSSNVELKKINSHDSLDIYEIFAPLTPLETSVYKFSYILPTKIGFTDTAHIQSYFEMPNGGWPYKIINEVVVPAGWKFKSSNKKIKDVDGRVYYNELVDRDVELNIVYEKK